MVKALVFKIFPISRLYKIRIMTQQTYLAGYDMVSLKGPYNKIIPHFICFPCG